MTPPFLHINGIRKVYGDVVATDHVELSVAEGEFMTFLGPSGSGKSTTLYILAGFQDPTAGDIRLRGQSILQTPSHKRNIGMVFQRDTLFPHLSVGENVAFPLRVRRMGQAEITEKVRRALKLVRLEGFEDRMPAKMSGGRRLGPGAGLRSPGAADGRAFVGPRQETPRGDPARDPPHPSGNRRDDPLRHP